MELKSLLNKIVEGGRLILTQPTMLFINKGDIGIMAEHEVHATEAGRADLIALQYYNDTSDLDYMLKFNGISDPFSINEGDILMIPINGPTNYKKLERPKQEEENLVRQEFLDSKRLTPKDKKRIDFLKKKYGVKEVLPPNVLKTGFQTFEFTDSSTIMGMEAQTPNVSYSSNISTNEANTETNEISIDTLNDEVKALFNKSASDLTIKELVKIAAAGINMADFESIKNKLAIENGNTTTSVTEQVFDTGGNFVGNESTIKSEVYDANKKTTTTTKTLVKPDGTVETIQTSTTENNTT